MHRLLERQLRKAFLNEPVLQNHRLRETAAPEFAAFVRMVDAAYVAEDEERLQFERSLNLASAELYERNRRLESELMERKRLEVELRVGEKLRAVGQLAAGIAHEINTPVQFVGDSLVFLGEAFAELCELVAAYEAALARSESEEKERVKELAERADLPFLQDSVPNAVARCQNGIERVAVIVRALKNMAHPDAIEQQPADLNAAIENTLVVSASQIKFVADVALELRAQRHVLCHVGEIQQVLLNLVVNAAHAIDERNAGSGRRGTIRITSREEEDDCVVTIADDGCGIPAAIRDRMFEPFFTTKPVGKGTGQGLCISRSLIVERHGGKLTFESRTGEGTIFTIRLPIHGRCGASERPGPQI